MGQFLKQTLNAVLVSLLLLLCLALPMRAEATEVASGTCGENLTWLLDDGGTLTISGEGDMEDYTSYLDLPWQRYRGKIINVIFDDTINKIGNHTFDGHYMLQHVALPAQLQILGEYCFNGCSQLQTLEIPASLLIWEDYAICANVKHLRFLGSAPSLGDNALYGLNSSTINYPSNDSSWDKCTKESASYGGFNLTWVKTIPNSLANGRCGVNAYWSISADGVITFSPGYGTGGMIGYMNDYETPTSVPWAPFKNQINAAVCEEGITHIGKNALYACTNLQSVMIPQTVAYVRDYALAYCYNLHELTFSGSAPTFSGNTFANTTATVYYPAGDATWTDSVKQTYGGTITWVAMDGPDTEENYIERMELEATEGSISAWPGTIISVNVVCTPEDASKDLVCSVSDSSILAYNESMGDYTTGFYFNCLKGGTATVTITDAFTGKSVSQVINVFTQPTIETLPYKDTVSGECRYSFTPEKTEVYTVTRDPCIQMAVIGGTLPHKSITQAKENILLSGNTVYEFYIYHRTDFCTGDQACSFGIDICKEAEGQILMLLEETVEVTLRTTTEPAVWRTQVYYTGTEPLAVTSNNTDVVEFDYVQDGNVWIKAKAAGTSILTVSDGFHSDSLTVIVKPAPYCPPDGHQYGKPVFSWQKYTSCTADFICTTCGDIQNVLCTVTSVTVPATENQEGKTTYTATASFNGKTHTDTNVETIPKKEHVHSFGDGWNSDVECHWKQCDTCNEKKDISVHTPGPEATENTSQKCPVCGRIIRTPLGLDWLFGKLEDPNNYLWATGYYVKIMEQYGDSK